MREGSLSRNWPLCEWNIYDRRTHSAFKIRSSTSLKMKLEYHDHFNNAWPYKIPYQERILSSLDDVLSLACSNPPLTKMARNMETLRNGEKYHLGKKVVTSQESWDSCRRAVPTVEFEILLLWVISKTVSGYVLFSCDTLIDSRIPPLNIILMPYALGIIRQLFNRASIGCFALSHSHLKMLELRSSWFN